MAQFRLLGNKGKTSKSHKNVDKGHSPISAYWAHDTPHVCKDPIGVSFTRYFTVQFAFRFFLLTKGKEPRNKVKQDGVDKLK